MYSNRLTNSILALILFAVLLIGGIVFMNYKRMQGDATSKEPSPNDLHEEERKIPGYAAVAIDPSRVQLLGLSTDKVIVRDLTKNIRTVGIVREDETRVAFIQTKFKGWIEDLYVNFTGIPVKKGDPLFTVYSQELLATQEELLLALDDVKYPKEGKFAKEFEFFSVDLLRSARRRLELWDVPSEEIARLEKLRSPFRNLLIRSPIEGIVIHLNAFVGMNVEPGKNLYTIADLSHVWVLGDLYEDDISFVQIGIPAVLTIDSIPGKTFEGAITFVDYVLQESTRTVKARFEFDNKEFYLKPGMYGTVAIRLAMGRFLALPEEALIDTGKRKIVFVEKSKGYYEPREVQLGFKTDQFYQILSGVSEGEFVVTSAQFLLDSESRLQASAKGNIEGKTH